MASPTSWLGTSAQPLDRTVRLLDPLRELLQRVLVHRPALAGPPDAAHDLLPAERLGDAGPLDHGEHRLLDGGEPPPALRARPAPADDLALVDLAGIHHPRVGMPAERAPHGSVTSLPTVTEAQPHTIERAPRRGVRRRSLVLGSLDLLTADPQPVD
jgi:hypothetical protein